MVFGLALAYTCHYTPLFGIAFERSAAVFFMMSPVVIEHGGRLLGTTLEAW